MTSEHRVVRDYGGLQILDAREETRIVVLGTFPPGLRDRLRNDGFKSVPNATGTYARKANPMTFAVATAIGADFYRKQETT